MRACVRARTHTLTDAHARAHAHTHTRTQTRTYLALRRLELALSFADLAPARLLSELNILDIVEHLLHLGKVLPGLQVRSG